MKYLSNGYSIEVIRKYNNEPTKILLHKLGSSDVSWLTPDELQRFIDTLYQALGNTRGGGDA